MSPRDCGHHHHRLRRRREPRRERANLDLDRIVEAAIELADTQGPQAVTMRGVASHLGVGVLSLYWYVSTKRDLEGEMCLRLLQESTAGLTQTGNWREDLANLARNMRRTVLRHGWLVDLVGRIDFKAQPSFIEGKLQHIEQAMRVVESLPVDMSTRLKIVSMIDNFTRGFALWEVIMRREIDAIDDFEEELLEDIDDPANSSPEGAGWPEPVETMLRELEAFDSEQQFEFALQTLLDGIEAGIRHATIGASTTTPQAQEQPQAAT